MLDCGKSTDNALGVGDILVCIERDVEVDLSSSSSVNDSILQASANSTYTDQDALALEVDVGDGELVGERHGCGENTMMAAGLAELFYSFTTWNEGTQKNATLISQSNQIWYNLLLTGIV
jgi:hypothetical protein